MAYPQLSQYDEALQSPQIVFLDRELKGGTVKKTGLGLPYALCGGFALTYTLTCGQKKYAVRCFHKKSNALELRYNAISRKLRSLSSNYFLNFEFQSKGIRVNNEDYPIVKMAWGAGEELGVFVENNFNNKSAIQSLKQSFLSLSSYLYSNDIAHGDIQNGNILINNAGANLQLIDYDGMYVDDIKNLGNSECGHKNFQHPKRVSQFDKHLDNFSLISVYLALQALENDKSVWTKSKPDGESILFKANDYAHPASSTVFSLLFSTPALSQSVKNFAAICESPYEKIPTLPDFINGKNIPQIVISITSKPKVEAPQGYISQNPVLDAFNYNACLAFVGERVEVIGKVHDIRKSFTKRGSPYYFINFDYWKGNIVKISIWQEGVSKLRQLPSDDWIGKWISVTGLMEPPFVSSRYGYSHISVTVSENNQLYIIDEHEAKFRLGSTTDCKPSPSRNINEEVLQTIQGKRRKSTLNSSQRTASRNQDILRGMQVPTSGKAPSSNRIPSARHQTQPPYQQQRTSYGNKNNFNWLFWVIGFIILINVLRHCK